MNMMTLANEAQTMTSREIADLTGKDHRKVCRDIEEYLGRIGDVAKFGRIYLDSMNRERKQYALPKRETLILVSGYNIELRARIVDRWEELESKQLARPSDEEIMMRGYMLTMQKYEALKLENKQQAEALEEAAPKVEFVDSYVEATGLLGFREVCKLLGIKEHTVRDWLVGKGIIYKLGGKWAFTASWLDAKNGEHKASRDAYGRAVTSIKFTPKGFAYIAQRISK